MRREATSKTKMAAEKDSFDRALPKSPSLFLQIHQETKAVLPLADGKTHDAWQRLGALNETRGPQRAQQRLLQRDKNSDGGGVRGAASSRTPLP